MAHGEYRDMPCSSVFFVISFMWFMLYSDLFVVVAVVVVVDVDVVVVVVVVVVALVLF